MKEGQGRSLCHNNEYIDGILFQKNVSVGALVRKLFVVPRIRKAIVVRNHDLNGHFGVDRVVKKITENYWFPHIRRYVKTHINSCLECVIRKVPSGKKLGFYYPNDRG